jgi:hypothetical protein
MTPDAAHGQKARLGDRLEGILFSIGFALLTIWGVKTLENIVFFARRSRSSRQTRPPKRTAQAPRRTAYLLYPP